ncbi:MAG TPA: hypothetical protein VN207_12840 [Ktedonobacteraceae bacterium]|nr:hypothetical protein [Ktedonobacteraceae bacterium]
MEQKNALPEVSFDERIHASAVQFLIQKNENDTAIALLACTFGLDAVGGDEDYTEYSALLRGPRWVYEIIDDENHPMTQTVLKALRAVMPWDCYVGHVLIRANLIDVEPDWKAQMLDIALGKEVHNQGVSIDNQVMMFWQNLRFRSESEKRIAEALDRAKVLFLPNCRARLTTAEGRKNKEPDFLVCYQGRWGILEVDGEPYHPPSRTVDDHKRDRDFRAYGIKVVEHYDARECYQQPDRVVRDFLNLLLK